MVQLGDHASLWMHVPLDAQPFLPRAGAQVGDGLAGMELDTAAAQTRSAAAAAADVEDKPQKMVIRYTSPPPSPLPAQAPAVCPQPQIDLHLNNQLRFLCVRCWV